MCYKQILPLLLFLIFWLLLRRSFFHHFHFFMAFLFRKLLALVAFHCHAHCCGYLFLGFVYSSLFVFRGISRKKDTFHFQLPNRKSMCLSFREPVHAETHAFPNNAHSHINALLCLCAHKKETTKPKKTRRKEYLIRMV